MTPSEQKILAEEAIKHAKILMEMADPHSKTTKDDA